MEHFTEVINNPDVSFLIGCLGLGIYLICIFVGMGLLFWITDKDRKPIFIRRPGIKHPGGKKKMEQYEYRLIDMNSAEMEELKKMWRE